MPLFLGVLLGLDTISRIDYLFTGETTIEGEELPSDVAHISESIGGHYLMWGVLLAVISIARSGPTRSDRLPARSSSSSSPTSSNGTASCRMGQ